MPEARMTLTFDDEELTCFLLSESAMELELIMQQPNDDRHTELALQLLREPAKSLQVWENAILRAQARVLAAQFGTTTHHGLTQKPNIHARIKGLPLANSIFYQRVPGSEVGGRLVAIQGTVTRLGPVRMMDRSRTFQCTKCGAKVESTPDDHQYGAIPKPTFCTAIIDDIRCPSTKFNPHNNEASTTTFKDDYQEIRIQELTSQLEIGAAPRSLTIVLRHDLVDKCKAGDEVTIVGWMVPRWKSVKSGQRIEMEFSLIANNIFISNNRMSLFSNQVDIGGFAKNFWDSHKNSPLKGRDILVSSFCPQIFGLYLVKLAVLLTIIGGRGDGDDTNNTSNTSNANDSTVVLEKSRKHRKEGHLLLVGDPGTAKSQFLISAAKISPRSVVTTGSGSTNAGLTVAAVKDSGEWQLEAGALVLADCGVCCIDEFNALRAHDRTAIHEAMEQQTLSVAKAGLVCKLQTRCSIVAACNSKGRFEEGAPISANVALASPLLSRFDLIIVMTDRHSSDWDRSLSDSILNLACKGIGNANGNSSRQRDNGLPVMMVEYENLRGYIQYVRAERRPYMSLGARIVLGKYYQLQRRADLRDAARTTIRLLESLIRLAQAHAKLMFQDNVEISDSIWAIVLMETSLATQSMLSMRPDVYAATPADPISQYVEYENAILKRLEINPKIIDSAQLDLDDEADEILASWQPTQCQS